jgi:ABC-type multidrug transport system ATPase subunit
MESLRHLAATGCTILCTTHVMGNAFLFDRLAVITTGVWYFRSPQPRSNISTSALDASL